MASSGSVLQLRLVLLMLLLAGAARASLYFRPGQTCYRPLRGDQLAQLGRRWARAVPGEEEGTVLGQARAPCHLGPCFSLVHPASLGLGNLIPSFWDDFHIPELWCLLGWAGLTSLSIVGEH